MSGSKKVLIINAHQVFEGISSGRLNQSMVDLLASEFGQQVYEVKHTYIEKGYDVTEEVDKHVWADVIVLQTPVYWFGSPWIYKKYVYEVFTAGMFQQNCWPMMVVHAKTQASNTARGARCRVRSTCCH